MYETIRIVGKLRPKYVVWENVKNLLSVKHKHNFDDYLNTMKSLGYTNYYQILNAKDYGVPQNRERVFTVSILGNEKYDFPKGNECNSKIDVVGNYMPSGHDASRIVNENGLAPTVKENHGTVTAVAINFEFPPKQPLKLKLKDVLEDNVDEKYFLNNAQLERMEKTNYESSKFENRVRNEDGIAPTLCARDYKDPKCVQIGTLDMKGIDQIKRVYSPDGLCPTLTTMAGGNTEPKIIIGNATQDKTFIEEHYDNFINKNQYIPEMFNPYHEKEIKEIAPTQTIQCGSTTSSATVLKYDGSKIRKLTPRECWRLMGFTDDEFNKAAEVNSNSQLYKQARKFYCG